MDWRMQNQTLFLIHEMVFHSSFFMFLIVLAHHAQCVDASRSRHRRLVRYSMIGRIPKNIEKLERLVCEEDIDCFNNLRLNKTLFLKLCDLLTEFGGLRDYKYVSVSEQLAMFLKVVAHHTKNRIVGYDFLRSGHTVSRYFHMVLQAILKLHPILLSKPLPINEDCDRPAWSCFKGCLGALDGTYVYVKVPLVDKPRYRNRKGEITTNVLAVCDTEMRYVYALAGWEGSAADGRVLRDAVHRQKGLKIPKGNYYLCDSGYANAEGCLTPFRGVRYHLKEWSIGCDSPQNYKEYFNMKHSKARSVIEKSFAALKNRWAVFDCRTHYNITTQKHIIMACMLLNNFILNELGEGAFDDDSSESEDDDENAENSNDEPELEFVDGLETSQAWTNFRENLAQDMYTDWLASRNNNNH